jgi:hypothetical protein
MFGTLDGDIKAVVSTDLCKGQLRINYGDTRTVTDRI